MKLKHTQARKARRASWFRESGSGHSVSKERREKRTTHPTPKTFGLQIKYIQTIIVKKDRKGLPLRKAIVKKIPHAKRPNQ